MRRLILHMDESTQLSIVAGDFNCTNNVADRQRPPEQDSGHIGNGEPIAPLLHADYIDTHKGGDMTNFTTISKPDGTTWKSKARLDRIFVWAKEHAQTINTKSRRMPFKTTHNSILTSIMACTAPIQTDRPPPDTSPRMNTRNLTERKKDNYATKVAKALEGKVRRLIQAIKAWEEDLKASNEAITEYSDILREVGDNHFAPPHPKANETQRTKNTRPAYDSRTLTECSRRLSY